MPLPSRPGGTGIPTYNSPVAKGPSTAANRHGPLPSRARWAQVMLMCAVVLAGSAIFAPSTASAAPPEYSLVTEPADGMAPIYDLITSAKHTLDMTMYELDDRTAESDMAADAKRGVKVRVLLDQNLARSYNTPAFHYLTAHGVDVRWAPHSYDVTHQKTLTVDGDISAVMTLNLTSEYYSTTRDLAIIDRDRADVAAIEAVFANDFAGRSYSPEPTGADLIWSPGADSRLVSIIASAKHSLYVENEEMSEYTIVDALCAAARRGVDVDVVMTYEHSWQYNFDKLASAGVHVRTYLPSAPLYIHAKVIVVDPGDPDEQLEVGSQNFSWASLEYNRELGLVLGTGHAGIIRSVAATVRSDFAGATPWAA
jgi:cardiolipin synthase A/B